MKVQALRIQGFRGIERADLVLDDHLVLIGPNGVGKSTIIDALCLVFGRSKLVPILTEHDFTKSAPGPSTRIRIVATLVGFEPDDPEYHRVSWFRGGRAVDKYWSIAEEKTIPERIDGNEPLCVEIGFCARFDREELTVEHIRYFHDDAVDDPFDDAVTTFPNSLLNEIGFYVLPARRTWELTVSFASELFRKAVATVGGVPANTILSIRDQLRSPVAPIEEDPDLRPLVEAMNSQLARLLPGHPRLQIRLTATDSESVLRALVPHYTEPGGGSLPAGRHGGGLLALQTLLLLLETGRVRRKEKKSFILALEEPELHVPPGLQHRIVTEAISVADQTICTTHAPRVAACYPADRVFVARRVGGALAASRLLSEPPLAIPNAARRLLVDERPRLLEALMYPLVLVPEGRIDFEWLRILAAVAQGMPGGGASRFEATVGIVPTIDSSVAPTVERLLTLRDGVFAVVDGDRAGNNYIGELVRLASPPATVVQWPDDWTVERIVSWVAEADPTVVRSASERVNVAMASPAELATKLASEDRTSGGLKGHYFAYEEVGHALSASTACAARAVEVLDGLADSALGIFTPRFSTDHRSTSSTRVLRFVPT